MYNNNNHYHNGVGVRKLVNCICAGTTLVASDIWRDHTIVAQSPGSRCTGPKCAYNIRYRLAVDRIRWVKPFTCSEWLDTLSGARLEDIDNLAGAHRSNSARTFYEQVHTYYVISTTCVCVWTVRQLWHNKTNACIRFYTFRFTALLELDLRNHGDNDAFSRVNQHLTHITH